QRADFGPDEFSPLMMAMELRKAGVDQSQLNAPAPAARLSRLPPVDDSAQRPQASLANSQPPPQPQQFAGGARQVLTIGDSAVKVYEFPGVRPREASRPEPAPRGSTVK